MSVNNPINLLIVYGFTSNIVTQTTIKSYKVVN